MATLTGFQRDLLFIVAGKTNASGQEIKDELEKEYSGEINHGRLYPNLDTLVNRELVEKGTIDRRTNSYDLTGEGYEALENHREWEDQYFS
ncbi:PadR family transcriptional regulator [Halobium palmae]|uniref:PadR family transcriptional regulator n=1 Tax=Halobium palmae TaxID=1776492 RepID=A0ABD5RVS3_9EURY